jgi:hypothetical protein
LFFSQAIEKLGERTFQARVDDRRVDLQDRNKGEFSFVKPGMRDSETRVVEHHIIKE